MKKLPRWMEPVYITQVLTGLAGIGAILISDNITKWHALVVGVIGCSLITSLIVSARAEADSQRSKKHVETLLRAMELPYFIIHALTPLIESSAKAKGWSLTRQENFRDETVYEFQSTGNERGRLVISGQDHPRNSTGWRASLQRDHPMFGFGGCATLCPSTSRTVRDATNTSLPCCCQGSNASVGIVKALNHIFVVWVRNRPNKTLKPTRFRYSPAVSLATY